MACSPPPLRLHSHSLPTVHRSEGKLPHSLLPGHLPVHRGRTSCVLALPSATKTTETNLFAWMHQMDGAHRELSEARRASNRAPKRTRICHTHAATFTLATAAREQLVRFGPYASGKTCGTESR